MPVLTATGSQRTKGAGMKGWRAGNRIALIIDEGRIWERGRGRLSGKIDEAEGVSKIEVDFLISSSKITQNYTKIILQVNQP